MADTTLNDLGFTPASPGAAPVIPEFAPATPMIVPDPVGDIAKGERRQSIKTLAKGAGPVAAPVTPTEEVMVPSTSVMATDGMMPESTAPVIAESTPEQVAASRDPNMGAEWKEDMASLGPLEQGLVRTQAVLQTAEAKTVEGSNDIFRTMAAMARFVSNRSGLPYPEVLDQIEKSSEYWARSLSNKISYADYQTVVAGNVLGSAPEVLQFVMGPTWAMLRAASESDGDLAGTILAGAERRAVGGVFHALGKTDALTRIPGMAGTMVAQEYANTGQVTAEGIGTGIGMALSGGIGKGNKEGLRQELPKETWVAFDAKGAELERARDAGEISPETASAGFQLLAADLGKNGKNSALFDTTLRITDTLNLLEGAARDSILRDQGVDPATAGAHIITGKTVTIPDEQGALKTAIEIYMGNNHKTIVEEFKHREYNLLSDADRKIADEAYQAYRDILPEGSQPMSMSEFYAKSATDAHFADLAAKHLAKDAPAWRKIVDASKTRWDALVEKVKAVPGSKVQDGATLTPAGAEGYQTRADYQVAPFYSPTARHIEGIDVKKPQPADFWFKQLWDKNGTPKPGLRPEEMADLGLEEYIRGFQDSGEKLGKDQVLQFIKDGGPKIEEVRKGEVSDPAVLRQIDALETERQEIPSVENRTPEQHQRVREIDAESERIYDNAKARVEPKFHAYQLPGGTNYREVLLTLPSRRPMLKDFKSRAEYDAAVKDADAKGTQDFTASHWDDTKNVLAHLRLNDRVDADGKRTLFVEEVQSDWHQKGRKDGYASEEAKAAWTDFKAEMREKYPLGANDKRMTPEDMARSEKIRAAAIATIPDAPFKKSWPMLAFKRVLREAAEKGYDKVAWTTGEQQAERYDLSKQVSKILYEDTGDGDFKVSVFDKADNNVHEKDYKASELADVVGKEVAEKMIAGEGKDTTVRTPSGAKADVKELSGLDLKVGGEGMKGFYDKMLPKAVQDYVKKLDPSAKVGEAVVGTFSPTGREADTSTVHSLDITPAMREKILREGQPSYQTRPLEDIIYDPTPVPPLDQKYAEGGNLNIQRIQSSDDVLKLINDVSRHNRETGAFEAATRGKRSWDVTDDAAGIPLAGAATATDPAMTVDQMLARKAGETANAEQMWAARQLQMEFAVQADMLNSRALSTLDATDVADALKALDIFAAVTAARDGYAAEAGRTLNIMAKPVGDVRTQLIVSAYSDLAKKFKDSKQILKYVADLKALDADGKLDIEKLAQFSRNLAARKSTTGEKIFECWINSLLMMPSTHGANLIGNTVTSAWAMPERALAGVIGATREGIGAVFGRARTGDRVALGETIAHVHGTLEGFWDGFSLAAKAWRSGNFGESTGKVESSHMRAVTAEQLGMDPANPMGKMVDFMAEWVLRGPTRALATADEYFKTVGYRAELRAQAWRQAAAEKLSGAAFDARYAELVNNPGEKITLAATDNAAYQTFTNDLGTWGQRAMGVKKLTETVMVDGKPVERDLKLGFLTSVIVPFMKTPANVVKYGLERTPLAFALYGRDIAGGGAKADLALARIAMGSMLGAYAAKLATQGIITGSGPKDPRQQENLKMVGWQPYSIRIGDTYYSYKRFDPLAKVVGMAADFATMSEWMDDSEKESYAGLIGVSFANNVLDSTFLLGAHKFFDAASDPQRYGEKWIQSGLTGFIPAGGALRMARNIGDPYVREVETLTDAFYNKLPGYSTNLFPKRDRYGEEIDTGKFWLAMQGISPIKTEEKHNEQNSETYPVDKIIRENHVSIPRINHNFHHEGVYVRLTGEEYDNLAVLAGKDSGLVNGLLREVGTAQFQRGSNGPDGDKAKAITNIFDRARKDARQKLYDLSRGEPGGLAERLADAKMEATERQMTERPEDK